MAKQLPTKPDGAADSDRDEARQTATAIGRSVIASLGRPTDFFKVTVIRLWDNHYRVNVQTGPDAVSTRIANSFFVAADEHGNVIESTPKIIRAY